MANSWLDELWRIIGVLGLAALLGLLFDLVAVFVAISAVAYLGWYLHNLRRIEHWFIKGRKFSPPQSIGIWGVIFNELHHLQKRHKKRNKRVVSLLGRFRETTEAMPDGVVVMKGNGNIEWWNEAAGEMLDLKYPADVGQYITNLIRNPEFYSFFHRHDQDEIFSYHVQTDRDESTIAIRITPYGNGQSLLMARDITLLARVEQIRRDFVANISHELRTPLTVMNGFLETFANDDTVEDPQLKRSIQLMQQQSNRMYRLVEDLMLLSKLENEHKQIKHEVVAVPQMLATLKEEAQVVSGERKHNISLDMDKELYLYGDAKELDSAFSNLVINAVNYTPDGGDIILKWYKDEQGAHFSVTDTGIGIPPHHIARLTERFYRVDVARSRETGGSGLGLAIVKHSLNRHDASLKIQSEIGKGSTFSCDFPLDAIVEGSVNNRQVMS